MKDRKIYKNTLRLSATPLALVVTLMSAAGLGRYVADIVLAGLVLTVRIVHLLPLSARWKQPRYHV